MTIALPTREKLSTDPPQTKEEAVFMFEVGEECQRRALRYLVEVADMSYGEIVKLAQQHSPNSSLTIHRLKGLAKRMKAAGVPLKTKQPERLQIANAKRVLAAKTATPVENTKPDFQQVQVTVEQSKPKLDVTNVVAEPPPPQQPVTVKPLLAEQIVPTLPATAAPRPTREQMLKGWTGQLGENAKPIHKRERPASKRRAKAIAVLVELKTELHATMKAAARDYKRIGAGILRTDMAVVDATLEKAGDPGVEYTLRQLAAEAREIQHLANESLRLLMFNS